MPNNHWTTDGIALVTALLGLTHSALVQGQIISHDDFNSMGMYGALGKLSNGEMIFATNEFIYHFDPLGQMLSVDTNRVGDDVHELLVIGDSLIVTSDWMGHVGIGSLNGDSIGHIAPSPLSYEYGQSYPNPSQEGCMFTFRLMRQSGIGSTSNGDLLLVSPTVITRRSIFDADTSWSRTIMTSPCGKPCFMEDAIELPNSEILVVGYSVTDTMSQTFGDPACSWGFRHWVGRLEGSTGNLIDSTTITCEDGYGCILLSDGNYIGTGLVDLIGTSDGGFAALFFRGHNRLLIKGSASGQELWKWQENLSTHNLKVVEMPDQSLIIATGLAGPDSINGSLLEQFSTTGELVCTISMDTTAEEYAWYGPIDDYFLPTVNGLTLNAQNRLFMVLKKHADIQGTSRVVIPPCTWQYAPEQLAPRSPFIYPQPCSGRLTVRTDEPCTAELSDATGRVVLNARLNRGEEQLDLSAQPNGVYVLRLQDESGKFSAQPVIVQH